MRGGIINMVRLLGQTIFHPTPTLPLPLKGRGNIYFLPLQKEEANLRSSL
jgi:hypothetical protein